MSVRVRLERVLDLTDEAVLQRLGVGPESLREPYSEDPELPSITQVLAIQARRSGIEGILAPSALVPDQTNLVVFRDNVPVPDAVEVIGFDDHVDGDDT